MSGGVPAGWVLVPVEPTETMLYAGEMALDVRGLVVDHDDPREAWSAMLSAIPTPTPPIEGRDADVERVARALCARNAPGTAGDTVGWIERQWQFYVPDARAALQALGERG